MKLRQLKAVLAVATSGSMNAAARVLNVSQPAITRSIAILEAELGTQLFRRTHTGTELTWQGEMLVRTGLTAMQRLRAIEAGAEEGIDASSIFQSSAFVRQVADHELAAQIIHLIHSWRTASLDLAERPDGVT